MHNPRHFVGDTSSVTPDTSMTFYIEPSNALAVAKAAENGKWTDLTHATLVFGNDVDLKWWCHCCGGERPLHTWQRVMTAAERQAALAHPLPPDELTPLPKIIVQGLLLNSPIESLTITVSEKYDVWANCGLVTRPAVFDVFSGLEHFYGVPPVDPDHAVPGYHAPELKLLRLNNWYPTKKELNSLALSFPSLTKVTYVRPWLIEEVKEALDQWFLDRLPGLEFLFSEHDPMEDSALEPGYRQDREPSHVYW